MKIVRYKLKHLMPIKHLNHQKYFGPIRQLSQNIEFTSLKIILGPIKHLTQIKAFNANKAL